MSNFYRDFYIIQYVKNIFRQEGRNIGVILQGDNNACLRVLGQVDQNTTDPEPFTRLNRLPADFGWFYQEWVNWFREAAEHEGREPEALKRLLLSLESKGYPFIVKDGGVIITSLNEPLDVTLSELFEQVIGSSGGTPKSEFEARLEALISTTGLRQLPGFYQDVELEFLPKDQPSISVRIPFLIAPPEGVRVVFKVVRTKNSIDAFHRQTNDAAFAFRTAIEHGFTSKSHCVLLTEQASKEKQPRLDYLASLANVIAISDHDAAIKILNIISTITQQ